MVHPLKLYFMKIILIDHCYSSRDALVDVLELFGFEVQPFYSIDTVRREGDFFYDAVVVCENDLPGKNTLRFCRELKLTRPEVPIIVLAGVVGEEKRRKGMENGIDHFLTKPIGIYELEKVIANSIGYYEPVFCL